MTTPSLKDYMHLYIGATITFDQLPYSYVHEHGMSRSKEYELTPHLLHLITSTMRMEDDRKLVRFKLHLRQLSDMTEEERLELLNCPKDWASTLTYDSRSGKAEQIDCWSPNDLQTMRTFWFDKMSPNKFTWLLSHSFDLFGLIDAGVAIDKKTI